MSTRTPVVINEFAKMRHLHLGAVAAMFVVGVLGLTLVGSASGGDGEPTWGLPLAGLALAFPIVSPLLIAVMASRTVEIEHQGNGWLSSAMAGADRGRLCRAKLVSVGAIVVAATVASSVAVLGVGSFLGIAEQLPAALWFGYTAAVCVVNVVVLAVHVLVSAWVDNQLIGLGVGILGTVMALCASGLPDAIAHLTPWGYYSRLAAADYVGDEVVTLAPSYGSAVVLAIVAAVLFSYATARLDRQEVAS